MRDFIKRFFFGLYWGSNLATRGNKTKGIKPWFSHRNFVQLLLPIRKKTNLKRIFGYFEQAFLVTQLPLL